MAVQTNNVYQYRMGVGAAGFVNRDQESTLEPNMLDVTNPPTAYGDPVKMGANGRIQALAPGDTAAAIYGWLVRPYPTQAAASGYPQAPFGAAAPVPGYACDVMKRGYMVVNLQGATAAAPGGAVFVRVSGTVPSGGKLNGVEAAVDGTAANTPQVPGTYFKGAADNYGSTEIAYNL